MRRRWMLLLDQYLGGFIIFLVTLGARFHRRKPVVAEKPCCVAVGKFFGLGSIIESLALLKEIKETYSQCAVLFVSFAGNQDLLKLLKVVDAYFVIRPDNIFIFVWDTLRCLFWLRRRQPQAFLNLEFFSRFGALMAYFSGAPRRIGFHTTSLRRRGALLTHRVHLIAQRHIRYNWYTFFHALSLMPAADGIVKVNGQTPPLPNAGEVLTLGAGARAELDEVKKKQGVNRPYIVFSPSCSAAERHLRSWPKQHWQSLVRMINQNFAFDLLATGPAEERFFIDEIFGPSVRNMAGALGFEAFLLLLKEARLVISLDSGPTHFADLFGTPVIALFGPDTPVFYGLHNRHSRNISLEISCSPCYNILEGKFTGCQDNICMQHLLPERVFTEAHALLGKV